LMLVAAGASDEALAELAEHCSSRVTTQSVSDAEVEQAIERLANEMERLDGLERIRDGVEDDGTADVRDLANQPPVIRYVNLLLREATDAGASDVHLEATREGLVARLRCDGILVPAPEPPRQMQHAVVSRIKTIADLDIAERRRPQDGRIRVRLADRELDLRVATIPTVHGESVVLRLLDRGAAPIGLETLGMPPSVRAGIERVTCRPHGMLLVTGPTGSGKTTTLYAALRLRAADKEKIITVEDPVEYALDGVTQVPVHRQAGITFAHALRAILRQDPDVVMIGEMRDRETAEIAVQASMTGHLVLSTLHTNDALGAIPRLLDLGVADYLVAGTLEAILAQRLVRRACHHCAELAETDPALAAPIAGRPLGSVRTLRARGCVQCRGTGYRGRTGLFELLTVTDRIRGALIRGTSRQDLEAMAREEGMRPMREHGWDLVLQHVTTLDEVLRVVSE
jgi:general secretion pathway protein E